MRIASGILMIIVGLTSFATIGRLIEMFGETWSQTIVCLCLLLLWLIVWGGISALRRKHWGLALLGTICAIIIACLNILFGVLGFILILLGIIALILLIKSKGEFV